MLLTSWYKTIDHHGFQCTTSKKMYHFELLGSSNAVNCMLKHKWDSSSLLHLQNLVLHEGTRDLIEDSDGFHRDSVGPLKFENVTDYSVEEWNPGNVALQQIVGQAIVSHIIESYNC